jgi:hypothetical protein
MTEHAVVIAGGSPRGMMWVADRFLAKGQVAQTAMFALAVVHMSASRPVIRMGSGSGRTRSSG